MRFDQKGNQVQKLFSCQHVIHRESERSTSDMTNTDQTMIDERAKIKKKMMLHMKRTREMFLNKEQYSIPEDKDR